MHRKLVMTLIIVMLVLCTNILSANAILSGAIDETVNGAYIPENNSSYIVTSLYPINTDSFAPDEDAPEEPSVEPDSPVPDRDTPEESPVELDSPAPGEDAPEEPSVEPDSPVPDEDHLEESPIDPVPTIPVSDIDIADVQSPMTVGTSQIISATIIPLDATDTEITYISLTPELASVNAIGRVRALSVGQATIQVSAGAISYTVSIAIEAKQVELPITATNIDVEYQGKMTVGETQMLAPFVLPSNAMVEFTYYSSNPSIASVNAFGKVQAVSAGGTTITISAGDIKKEIRIIVENEQKAEDIDLGEVQPEMTIGTTQLLSVSVYPAESAEQDVQYTTSNRRILEVNSFGRVRAVGIGTAKITAHVGSVSKSIAITVTNEIQPTDIDFDSTVHSINIGATIMLNASVLPTNAVDQTITYTSSNTKVLTVNEIGRIRGVSLGTAIVTLQAGDVSKTISIRVVEKTVVTNIDVRDFNEKMKIDETQTLSTSVYPTDAEDQKVTYKSSNASVATVSEGGVITAIGKGSTTITLSAGTVVKELNLTVYVATESLQITDNYLIMQPSDSYKIYAAVKPVEADQNILFRSTNENVAKVTSDGTISAMGIGRASIILSNEDSMKSITVIVNDGNVLEQASEENENMAETQEKSFSQLLSNLILEAENEEVLSVGGSQYSYVTTDVLRTLYQTKKKLRICYDDYSVFINGETIKNAEKSFSTLIQFFKTEEGISFSVNSGQNLPGSLIIEFLELTPEYKYMYLYNDTTKKYERLNDLEGKNMTISIAGEYLLTTEKLPSFSLPQSIVLWLVVPTITIAVVVYIAVKRRYWFW